MMRMRTIVLAFSCAASGLALAAPSSAAAPPQEREQAALDSKEGASRAEPNKMAPAGKVVSDPEAEPFESSQRSFEGLGKRFLEDQKQIWTSPARLRFSDADWLLPLGGVTAGLFVTDASYSRHLSQNPTTLSHYKTLSDAGVGALIGGAGGMWLLGHVKHNEHWSETGFLAGEAALNSLVAVESFKYSLRRERPYQGNGSGSFFQSGGTSFPSEHAAAAWSVAGVIAHEYPGPLTKIMAYGLASLVDISRVRAQQHFPSDVVVGAVIGNLIAQNIYSRHHDPDLGGGEWRSWSAIARGFESSGPQNLGSPYVPLDSWIYPALERLAGLGLIDSGFAGLRPWTRRECMRQLGEAEEKLTGEENNEVQKLVDALQRELRPESEAKGDGEDGGTFRLESIYSRTEHISGMPLTDSYHFAQTQINDFGRPYAEGWNTVNGFSTYATRGAWAAYVRGEMQTAPSIPALPLSAREFVAASARTTNLPSPPPDTPAPAIRQFQLLDAYVGLTLSNWEVSFGRQSFLWGPGEGGAMMFSDNVTPINVFRVNRVSPLQLPSILKFLGPMRMEFFVGQLEGHQFVLTDSGVTGSWSQSLNPQPWMQGEKISIKPSPDLEVGFSYMSMFAGLGVPATPGTFVNSLFDTGGDLRGTSLSKSQRMTGLDFSYRIPKLRKWLTIYGDGFAQDQIIYQPGYPERAVWKAGIYVPMFPGLRKLDLRAEGGYTDNPLGNGYSNGFYYTANRYLNGQTSNGNVIGSWMGRAGQGAQAWTNYWFNARDRIQLNFRHLKVSQEFIPGGGTSTDVGVRGDYWVRPNLSVSASVQYERWFFPVIQPNPEKNVTATVEILFQPEKIFRRSSTSAAGSASGIGGRP